MFFLCLHVRFSKELKFKYWSNQSSVAMFQEWVKFVNSGDFGMYSYILAAKYGDGRHNFYHLPTNLNYTIDQMHMEGISNHSATCWIHQKNLNKEFKKCMKRFKKIGGVVDMNKFAQLTNKSDHNRSKHNKCASYYDEKTRKNVETKDRLILEKFGLHCCM